jgi:uncharacterized membrane protein YbhN (UPF0104 family)
MARLWSTITATTTVIGHAKIVFVAIACAVDTLSLILMAVRWRLLLRSAGSGASLWETLLAYSAGVFVSNITPARILGGDTCRAVLIPRPGGWPPMKSIAASVVYDRATDVPGFLMLGAIALPTLQRTSPHWALLALIALVAALVWRPIYRRLAQRLGRWHQALVGRKMTGSVFAAVGCSLIIWLLDVTRIMLVGAAFDVRFVPSQAAAVSLLRLGSGLVPVPGGVGVVDGALVAGFLWLGVPPATAAALAFVERVIVFGWATALGGLALLLVGGRRALKNARGGAAPSTSLPAELPD